MQNAVNNCAISKSSHSSWNRLPVTVTLKNGSDILLDGFKSADEAPLYAIMHEVVKEGGMLSQKFINLPTFRDIFCSHNVFTYRDAVSLEIIGATALQPRTRPLSHLFEISTIIKKPYRNIGIFTSFSTYLFDEARDMGCTALYGVFFESNSSCYIWNAKNGFQIVSRIPKMLYHTDEHVSDAIMVYREI